MTLNAQQGLHALHRRHRLLPLRDAMRAANADLVFLQEVGVAGGSGSMAAQYETLADSVWTAHAYGRNAAAAGGHHGNALLSKYPILHWRNEDASVGRKEPRGFLHCSLGLPASAGALHAICVHFALLESHRRRQVDMLVRLVEARVPRDAPLLIAGDFNDWRGRTHLRLPDALGLEDACADASGRPPRSFPSRFPLFRLDRIYARNLAHRPLQLPRKPWHTLSDHVPIACEIQLPA